jgi:hypothetical protein
VSNAPQSKGTRGGSIKLRGVLIKHCDCGHIIGIETTSEPHCFYNGGDWDSPIEICPSCHKIIEADKLTFSVEQQKHLGKIYQLMLNQAQESR